MVLETTMHELKKYLLLNCKGQIIGYTNTQPDADKIGEVDEDVCFTMKITRTKEGIDISDLLDLLGVEPYGQES